MNPYERATTENSAAARIKTRWSVWLFAIALNFYSVAALFYFFCESWSFNTPYSTENNWQVSLPGGFGFFFSARLGWTLVIGLIASGTLFLLFAIVAHRIARTTPYR